MAKTLSVYGSTGSIGVNTLDLVAANPEQFDVKLLSGHSNITRLIEQARIHHPEMVVIGRDEDRATVTQALPGVDVLVGAEGLRQAASMPVDISVCAIVGMAGLPPVMEAIRQGGVIAFASKECLVSAGHFMMDAAQKSGATLLPVDSEHNALFQVFDAAQKQAITRLVLTASGGPFRQWSAAEMAQATPEQALAHPNWSMGAKISIDSATMMNKALEVIEAAELFDMKEDRIDVLVHPQSLVHGMVEYSDGSVLTQMGPADMRTALSYCLAWPKRMRTSGPMLDWDNLSNLSFAAADLTRFPCLRLGREAMQEGLAARVILNAANEIAVAAFLERRIGFAAIAQTVETALETIPRSDLFSLDDVVAMDHTVRQIMTHHIETKTAA